MTKCGVCRQIVNNLIEVYSDRLKSLAQIIFKSKGFKESLNANKALAVCGNCLRSLENLAVFWESIPENESENDFKECGENPHQQNEQEKCSTKDRSCQPVMLKEQKQYETKRSGKRIEINFNPLSLRINLPSKRKNVELARAPSPEQETLQKRLRRPPKRYEDSIINDNRNPVPDKDSLKNLPHIAMLRSTTGRDIGKLVEVKDKSKVRLNIVCEFCYENFHIEKEFQAHLKSHNENHLEEKDFTKDYMFYCILCNKPFSDRSSVTKHFKLAHSSERSLKCDYCEATFKYKSNLSYHLAKHVPTEGFECGFCKKTFLVRYELQIHLRTHTKEKPYKCEFCDSAFAHRSNLKVHQKAYHSTETSNQKSLKERAYSLEKTNCFIFQPPETMIEKEEASQNSSKDRDLDNNETEAVNFENFSSTKTEKPLENTVESEPKLIKTAENKYLKLLEAYGSGTGQPKLGTFHFDSRILKSLSPPSLLGLKKWPKSFNNTYFDSMDCTENTNNFETENAAVGNYENSLNYSSSSKNFQSLNLATISSDNTSDTSKSLIKYEPTDKTKSIKQFIDPTSSSLLDNISKEKTLSFENFKEVKINENCKFINTPNTKTPEKPSSSLELSKYENTDSNDSDSVEKNFEKTYKVAKVSTKPVKIQSILNSKKLPINLSTNVPSSTLYKTANDDTNTSNELLETLKEFLVIPEQTKVNSLTNASTTCSSSTNISEYFKTSQQSLLKPLGISHELTKSLPDKPLVTKMEILPPLKLSFTNQPPESLIKSPSDYKYQCPFCYKYFTLLTPLKKHIRTHTGEKPYTCNLCHKSYSDASNYRKHKILHKNAAEALNISRTTTNPVPNSPAYSTVSDPDPDGIELMQTLKKYECSFSTDDENNSNDDDNVSLSSSTMESEMWHNALENALMNEELRENIKRNLQSINNTTLPKSVQHAIGYLHPENLNANFSTEDPD